MRKLFLEDSLSLFCILIWRPAVYIRLMTVCWHDWEQGWRGFSKRDKTTAVTPLYMLGGDMARHARFLCVLQARSGESGRLLGSWPWHGKYKGTRFFHPLRMIENNKQKHDVGFQNKELYPQWPWLCRARPWPRRTYARWKMTRIRLWAARRMSCRQPVHVHNIRVIRTKMGAFDSMRKITGPAWPLCPNGRGCVQKIWYWPLPLVLGSRAAQGGTFWAQEKTGQ